jgi:hypothetical protein
MNAEERSRLLREVERSGNCSHPVRLSGESVNLATGEVGPSELRVACKDRRHVICPACSYLYKADAWVLVSTGLNGGKGIDSDVSTHPRLFVTLTAPSFGSVHTITARGDCASRGTEATCRHGLPLRCPVRHRLDDPELGRPLCADCFDYEGAVLWNAHASRLWNVTVQQNRRGLAREIGVTQAELKLMAQLHYLKVAEIQRRGLVHLHAILRADGPDGIESEPPVGLTSDRLAKIVGLAIRSSSITGLAGCEIRWGRVLDIRDLATDPVDAQKVASYVAKYATKTTDGSRELARRFRSRRQAEILVDDPHIRRLVLTAWDLAERPELEPLHLRDHAHALGFTGQLITKSRAYSTTFRALRSARATYMADRREGDPVEGTFRYDGRGYDDPRGTELAELFFRMQRELREEAATASRNAVSEPRGEPL